MSSILDAFYCAFGFSLCPTWVISSHPSVPELRNLVNKQALERAGEPATSWKYEATRSSTEMLSFQEGVTESEQRPWLPISPRPSFPALSLSVPHLRTAGCGVGAGITHHTPQPQLSCTSPSCLWHVPQDSLCPQSQVESSFLSISEKNAIRKLNYFENVEYSILMEPFSMSL